jgi:septum formation protein
LDPSRLDAYLTAERPYDCAGGFKVEGLGLALFERIESQDPTALIGLPLIWVAATLRAAGLDALSAGREPR